MKNKTKHNVFGEKIAVYSSRYLPLTYQVAREVGDEKKFNLKIDYVESNFYNNKKMICYGFYKPISKII